MITDKDSIDQLFRAKLRDYEAPPPPSVWIHIHSEIRGNERARKITFLKGAGIAAAVLSAFLAGWWLTNPKDLIENPDNAADVKDAPKTEVANSINLKKPLIRSTKASTAESGLSDKRDAGFTNFTGRQYKPSITSMATFAPDTSFINKTSESSISETKEPVLFDVEKEFLSHFQSNLKLMKQLSDWVTTFNNNNRFKDTIHTKTPGVQSIRQPGAYIMPVIAADSKKVKLNDKRNNWTLCAELSPVSITQREGGSSISGQQTSYENSVSGSLMAGYIIRKRIVVKSGIIVSQLRQVTRIQDYPPAYSSVAIPFKTANLATSSGSVNLNRAVALQSDVLFSNDNLPVPGIQPELKQEFSYIEIPIQMVYKLIDHKFNLGVTGGVSTNILAGNRAGLYENGQRINHGQTSNIRDITYSGALGVEFGYDIGNKVAFTIEPRIKRFLNSLSSNEAIDFKPYQLDIMTGVTYSFN
jgi:hypothetical protein